MLLFKPEHVPMILSGQKTVTRRFWKKRRAVPGSIHQACLALSGPGRKPFAKLRILEVYQERVGDISNADIQAEGYTGRNEYYDVLLDINKGRFPNEWDMLHSLVWVVRFEVAEIPGGSVCKTS